MEVKFVKRPSSMRLVESYGRNGIIKTSGIDIYKRTDGDIELSPLTSKGFRGRGCVTIPKEDMGALIAALMVVNEDTPTTVSVYAYVEGGVVQGARSDADHVAMEIFDVDNKLAEGMSRDDIEKEWEDLAEKYVPNIVF